MRTHARTQRGAKKGPKNRGKFLKRVGFTCTFRHFCGSLGRSRFPSIGRGSQGLPAPPSLQGGMAMGGQGVGPGAGAVVRYLAGTWQP